MKDYDRWYVLELFDYEGYDIEEFDGGGQASAYIVDRLAKGAKLDKFVVIYGREYKAAAKETETTTVTEVEFV